MDFDRILASSPINQTAARVLAKGVHYTPNLKPAPETLVWDAPPLRVVPPKDAIDYSGHRRGRMVAFQFFQAGAGKGAKWVVRCDCGMYEVRRIAAWVKCAEPDACRECRHKAYVQRGYVEGKVVGA